MVREWFARRAGERDRSGDTVQEIGFPTANRASPGLNSVNSVQLQRNRVEPPPGLV